MKSYVFLLLPLALFLGCQDKLYEETKETKKSSYAFNGTVELGAPITGAAVYAYEFSGLKKGQKLAEAISNQDGSFELKLDTTYEGPLLLTAKGGVYRDLVSDEVIALKPEQELSSAITHIKMPEKTNINAWTTMAVARVMADRGYWDKGVEELKDSDRINMDFSHISYFLSGKSSNVVNVRRQDLFNTQKDSFALEEPKVILHLAHGGLSQIASDLTARLIKEGVTVSVADLLSALTRDLTDRVFDGRDHKGHVVYVGNSRRINLSSYTMRKELSEAIKLYSMRLQGMGLISLEDKRQLETPGTMLDYISRYNLAELFPEAEQPKLMDNSPPRLQISFANKHSKEGAFPFLSGDVDLDVEAHDETGVKAVRMIEPKSVGDSFSISFDQIPQAIKAAEACDKKYWLKDEITGEGFLDENIICACIEAEDVFGNSSKELICFQREPLASTIISPLHKQTFTHKSIEKGIILKAKVTSGLPIAECSWSLKDIQSNNEENVLQSGTGVIDSNECTIDGLIESKILLSGNYQVVISAKDVGERELDQWTDGSYSPTVSFQVFLEPPTVQITSPNDNDLLDEKEIYVSGTVDEPKRVKEIQLSFKGIGEHNQHISGRSNISNPASSREWSATLGKDLPPGEYEFDVLVIDIYDQQKKLPSRTVVIDQAPKSLITFPTAETNLSSKSFEEGVNIKARVTSGLAISECTWRVTDSLMDKAGQVLASGVGVIDSNVCTIDEPMDGTNLKNGTYFLVISAKDVGERKLDQWTDGSYSPTVSFQVFLEPPTVQIISPNDDDLLDEKEIYVSGTVDEPERVKEIQLSFKGIGAHNQHISGRSNISNPASSREWSATLGRDLPPGEYELDLLVIDIYEQQKKLPSRTVVIDQAPKSLITFPTAETILSSKSFEEGVNIKARVTSGLAISECTWRVTDSLIDKAGQVLASGVGVIDSNVCTIDDSMDGTNLKNGTHFLVVTAKDVGERELDQWTDGSYSPTVSFQVFMEPPTVQIISPNDDDLLDEKEIYVAGTVDEPKRVKEIQLSFKGIGAHNQHISGRSNISNPASSREWSATLGKDLPPGEYELDLLVIDIYDQQKKLPSRTVVIDQAPKSLITFPTAETILSSKSFEEGVNIKARVTSGLAISECTWRVTDSLIYKAGQVLASGVGVIDSNVCTIDEPMDGTNLKNGTYFLVVSAKDVGERVLSDEEGGVYPAITSFVVIKEPSTVRMDLPSEGYFSGQYIPISAYIESPDLIKEILITFRSLRSNEEGLQGRVVIFPKEGKKNWSAKLGDDLMDGSYAISMVVKDIYGNEKSYPSKTVVMDSKPPIIQGAVDNIVQRPYLQETPWSAKHVVDYRRKLHYKLVPSGKFAVIKWGSPPVIQRWISHINDIKTAPQYSFRAFDDQKLEKVKFRLDHKCSTLEKADRVVSEINGHFHIPLVQSLASVDLLKRSGANQKYCLSIWAVDRAGNATNHSVEFIWHVVSPPVSVDMNSHQYRPHLREDDFNFYGSPISNLFSDSLPLRLKQDIVIGHMVLGNPHATPLLVDTKLDGPIFFELSTIRYQIPKSGIDIRYFKCDMYANRIGEQLYSTQNLIQLQPNEVVLAKMVLNQPLTLIGINDRRRNFPRSPSVEIKFLKSDRDNTVKGLSVITMDPKIGDARNQYTVPWGENHQRRFRATSR